MGALLFQTGLPVETTVMGADGVPLSFAGTAAIKNLRPSGVTSQRVTIDNARQRKKQAKEAQPAGLAYFKVAR